MYFVQYLGTELGRTKYTYGMSTDILGRIVEVASGLPLDQRARGSMYFPTTLLGIYQASQILAKEHLLRSDGGCTLVPEHIRSELQRLKEMNSHASVGKEYWGATARALGVVESGDGCLRFTREWGAGFVSHDDSFYPASNSNKRRR